MADAGVLPASRVGTPGAEYNRLCFEAHIRYLRELAGLPDRPGIEWTGGPG
jgi:hypothetical protein